MEWTISSTSKGLYWALLRWLPLALPIAMVWLLYANFTAFRTYQRNYDPGIYSFFNSAYYPLKIRHPDPPAGRRPKSFPLRHYYYYWIQDLLRGTTLVIPQNVKVDEAFWHHLALVNPVSGKHRPIDSVSAEKLAQGAAYVEYSGWIPGPKQTLARRLYFPESIESIKGKRAYWVMEQGGAEPRTFVLSEALFERYYGTRVE